MKRKSLIRGLLNAALVVGLMFQQAVAMQSATAACKKWTYDHSETVKYSDTPLKACENYVKEKYPNDNEKASIEATNDPEMYRCSGGSTYIGIVYLRECANCCKKPAFSLQLSIIQKTFGMYQMSFGT